MWKEKGKGASTLEILPLSVILCQFLPSAFTSDVGEQLALPFGEGICVATDEKQLLVQKQEARKSVKKDAGAVV